MDKCVAEERHASRGLVLCAGEASECHAPVLDMHITYNGSLMDCGVIPPLEAGATEHLSDNEYIENVCH